MNLPFNEIEFPQLHVFVLPSKKPMATHQASINIQEPTKFKLEATRTRVEYRFQLEPNSTNPQIRVQFENQALQIRARILQAARIRIRAHNKQTLSRQICTRQILQLKQQALQLMIRQSAA